MRSGLAWKFRRSGRSHGNSAIAEPGGGEDAAHDTFFFLAVLGDRPGRAVLELDEELQHVCRLLGRNLTPLVAEAPAHRRPERGGVDELHPAPSLGRLPVADQPYVGGDAGVVEELFGERDQRLQEIVLQDEAADLALAAPRVAGEERRAVHDDRDARAAFVRRLRPREHVEEEQGLAVADARQPGAEASGHAPRSCSSRTAP